MKKIIAMIPALLMAVLPVAASAHQHASYVIGGVQYDFVIGSLNEPLLVDDKTGVDLRVTSGGHMMMAEDGDMEPAGGAPASGLEKDLKVELIAGDKKKTLDLSPVYGTPGSYKAVFIPTVATTYQYRVFGQINNTPVDVTFTCKAEGQDATEEGEKEISTGVRQLMKGGSFGCPAAKASAGFPEPAPSTVELAKSASGARSFGVAGIALGAIALAWGAFRRRR